MIRTKKEKKQKICCEASINSFYIAAHERYFKAKKNDNACKTDREFKSKQYIYTMYLECSAQLVLTFGKS